MAEDRPLLNPVLRLRMEPKPETQPGGGKSRDSIKTERLKRQQRVLSEAADDLYSRRARLSSFGGRTHLLVRMFAEDSLAPSYTPTDLFAPLYGCQLVAPFKNGYLVEATLASLPGLADAVRQPANLSMLCDISRVKSLTDLSASDRLRDRTPQQLWDAAPADDRGRLFVVWLAPFRHRDAQEELLTKIDKLAHEEVLLPTTVRMLGGPDEAERRVEPVATPTQSSIARAMRSYRNRGIGRAAVHIPTIDALRTLVASGISHRIDPVRPIYVAAPGEGREPKPPANLRDAPIVGVVDGGLHASSYAAAEAWRAPPFISNANADRNHGNAVTSLVVQGHAWNKNRNLPALDCRIGTVQAVPHKDSRQRFDERELVDYLAAVMRAHPETRVWNISANQEANGFDQEEVSVLGYELNELSRAANVLPVISIGNKCRGGSPFPNPPADCESAVVVGGRQADKNGNPANACPHCLSGPGPDGMLKPDVSWFSQLRVIGGAVATGSSYSTALVSSLAAHTFANLREPTPDLVKALLLNACELPEHDAEIGWGTPFQGHLPWVCTPGSVTLAWRAVLEPGANYYWNDIPIPPEMIRNGKLAGRASLTAVLRPLTSPFGGANYFSSRLQTSLRYRDGKKWKPLVGSMQESSLEELDARESLKKWQPIRRHSKDFAKRGRSFTGRHLQLYARVFTRDLYQFGWHHHSLAGPQEVAFVLTLRGATDAPSIYDSTVSALGNFVESAVLNQDIEIGRR